MNGAPAIPEDQVYFKTSSGWVTGHSVTYWKSRKARGTLKMNKRFSVIFQIWLKFGIRDLPSCIKQTCFPSGPLTPCC